MKVSDKEYAVLRSIQSLRDDISYIRDHISCDSSLVSASVVDEVRREVASDVIKRIWSSTWYRTCIEYPALYKDLNEALRSVAKSYGLENIF